MGRLEGKRAFVTGAGAGIGRAIAAAFAEEGARVAVVDVDEERARETAAALPDDLGTALACDVADRAAIFRTMELFTRDTGGLDTLVNNAVFFHYAPLVEMPEEVVGRMIDVGLKGAIWSLQAATPHLIAQGGGAVINLSSIAVSFAIRNAAVYSAIKGALDTLTRQQAIELGEHGVRVNALAPGSVVTPGASTVIDEAGWETRRRRTPLQRLATAEEIAAAAVFLASDEARSIAGVTLKVDGAITIAGP